MFNRPGKCTKYKHVFWTVSWICFLPNILFKGRVLIKYIINLSENYMAIRKTSWFVSVIVTKFEVLNWSQILFILLSQLHFLLIYACMFWIKLYQHTNTHSHIHSYTDNHYLLLYLVNLLALFFHFSINKQANDEQHLCSIFGSIFGVCLVSRTPLYSID